MFSHAFSRLPAFCLLVAAVLASASVPARSDATDRIGVPGPISFDGTDYVLAWSSNPSEGYYKQEYVPAGQTVETYTRMVLVEAAAGTDVTTVLAAQVDMLNKRKASDPLVNMDIIMNDRTGEAVLDFIMSAKDEQGAYIVEWNAYRYSPLPDDKGVSLFAISHRAYGDDDVRAFLGNLRTVRPGQINALAQAPAPTVSIAP